MKRLETFKELFEEVKKLYPETEISCQGILYNVIHFEKQTRIAYCKKGKWEGFYFYGEHMSVHHDKNYKRKSKDPQKIYNVIKSIKECEDEK